MSETNVVLIGVFDGVHKGHQQLLNRAKEIAAGRSIVALTFDPHPTTVYAPTKVPTALTTLADRVELLKIHNADQVAVMKFNENFAAMSAADFVTNVLVGQLHASTVVVGKNFTYGHKAAGNVDSLIADGLTHNFTVDVQELKADTEVISSSRIRALVIAGKVEEARALLSRPHRLDGVVVHGEKRGREIGYPTANLGDIDGQTIPADGVYAGWLTVGINFWPAAISIGTNPTFAGERGRQVEAYALDQEGLELYDKNASIEFGWYLRPTLKFDSLEELLVQMKKDCDKARELTEK
ncbi:MAG: bifunctional riboflavin kinase/FAD synthetase [Candidatus Planktophila sp.]|nr:bifunctional riboflavin kinase/FAD synthetase [Candidatus Planktophila sp.]MSO24774.1 bifunctional riboflavin kinase/FAD synthetase [Candidatus Planktophila sp.]PHX70231.1 MAG: riboflavin biosynthesis protein RibF [Actinomycetota bacterium]